MMDELKDKVKDLLTKAITGFYWCERVWDAWNIGTMTQDDFTPAEETEDWLEETIIDLINTIGIEYELKKTPSLPDPCTVEQWEEITGETFPDDGMVWFAHKADNTKSRWGYRLYKAVKNYDIYEIFIVQTANPAPEGRRE